uniref:F-box domain-containing protein n=1 Tax=Homalodisca liturata TaxID=320908 RepID=A0A1B6IKK6_9HEMI
MEPAGILSLPIEVVHHLSSFLSVEDVLSCSLTCHYLRFALNDNTVWKRYLPEQDLTRLESLEQHVQPTLQLEQTLTPLCDNRIHFMRKTRLLNNWREGNFVGNDAKPSFNYYDGRRGALKGRGQLIYQDRYLFLGRFINDVHSDGIEIWDLDTIPVLHSVLLINDVDYDSFYVVGTYLVVVICFIVNVHSITIPEKEYPLSFSFSITEEDVTFNQQCQHFGGHDERCVGWKHWTVDQYLVSNKCGENVIHIWDITKACKIGSFCSPFDAFFISVHLKTKEYLFLRQNTQFPNENYLLKFCIENRTFSEYSFKYGGYPQHIIIYGSHVILFKNADQYNSEGWYDTVCTVHDFNTSLELKKRRFNNANKNNLLQTTTVVNGKFIILCFDCFQIIDALSLETLDHFQCDFNVKYIVHHFNVLGSVFVVTSDTKYVLDMWDITKKRKVPLKLKAVFTDPLCSDNMLTKLTFLTYYKIQVYRFW